MYKRGAVTTSGIRNVFFFFLIVIIRALVNNIVGEWFFLFKIFLVVVDVFIQTTIIALRFREGAGFLPLPRPEHRKNVLHAFK